MTVEDELGILRTLAAYCQLVDDGDFAGVASKVYAPDGSFVDRGVTATGPEAIEQRFHEIHPPGHRGKHLCSNPVIEIDGDRASVVSDFVFLGWTKSRNLVVRSAGRYVDAFVRIDGAWRIHARDIQMLVPPSP